MIRKSTVTAVVIVYCALIANAFWIAKPAAVSGAVLSNIDPNPWLAWLVSMAWAGTTLLILARLYELRPVCDWPRRRWILTVGFALLLWITAGALA